MSSSNALGWVFPGPGSDVPPTFSEATFGPVHYKDSMVIEFTPVSYTGEIRLYCDWQNAQQGNVWTLANTGSPFTYNFNQKTPNPDDPNDYHVCHFFFAANSVSTSSGNTLAFQYMNNSTNKAITWSAKGSANTSPSITTSIPPPPTTTSTSTSTSSKSTSKAITTTSQTTLITTTTTAPGQSPVTGLPSPPGVTPIPQPSGLSGGVIAGIVIGVLALIAIIAGLGFFFGRRVRRNRSEGPSVIPARDESNIQPMYKTAYPFEGYYGQPAPMERVPAWASKQNGQPVKMGELHGGYQAAATELDTRAVAYELGDGYRNELP